MELIERYLQEVGRALPSVQQKDILSKLRSALYDALEGSKQGDLEEAHAAAVLKQMGAPREVAASYFPEGQYLIGPTLYPLFKKVFGIVLTAILGTQLLLILLSFTLAGEAINLPHELWSILKGLPVAFGLVVIIFYGVSRCREARHWARWGLNGLKVKESSTPPERQLLLAPCQRLC